MTKAELKESAAELEKEYPRNEADSYIIQRFRFEPRGESSGGFSCRTWLVIYDCLKRRFLKQEENTKAYIKFHNSRECIEYLRSKFIKEEK